jgi:ADP-ribose pyrophosphatase YjhB (NUDIX family)
LQCPGGHLEYGETFAETAAREVLEETGLEVGNIKFLTATNDVFGEGKHYVTIFVTCTITGENKVPQVGVHLLYEAHGTNTFGSRWNRTNAPRGNGYPGVRCGLGRESRRKPKMRGECRSNRCFCRLSIFGESILR